MPKVSIIGAGGVVFPLTLIRDILSFAALRGSTITLMDIDAARLQHTHTGARALIERFDLPTQLVATTDRRAALAGADYVIVCFQVGGLAAYQLDVEIPRRYGIDQCVGDTLGPGGVMRGLRSIPVLLSIAQDMQELCPNALLIQYANPMAMNSWALNTTGIRNVGLCHSVQGTSQLLARRVGVPYEQVSFRSAGINHQAWFIEFRHGDEDLYPRIREVMAQRYGRAPSHAAADNGDHSQPKGDSLYEGGSERVRTAIMRTFGYFHTESSHHASEYVPYFRKNPELVREYIPERWDYFELCLAHEPPNYEKMLAQGLTPSHEYGAFIIDSMETGTARVIYGNVENRGLITNLPAGCCVEVACLVDSNGVQPTVVGDLPPQLAALNRACIAVQERAVHAAIHGDRAAVYQAIALDPLTAALLTLDQIHSMTDELLAAEAQWLPALR
ncbi:MAG: alpha-glucosidase/alpha-galactosidase [Roseiflexaceae bacterium]|nr:alpha-glucosidase/alpha-galactosidase [Roseiflexaceae bacterium]